MNAARIREAGDAAFLIEIDARIDETVHARVVAIAGAVRTLGLPGVLDVVPTFRSVAVHFDPFGADPDHLRRALEAVLGTHGTPVQGRLVEVPVQYGGDVGPDLDAVAAWAGCAPEHVVRLHSGTEYRVYMLGFLPGFAYLAPVDRAIAMPRRGTPRVRVPAGSVAIAGGQTGIYPVASPGGWHVIGRTAMRLFDPARADVAWVRPGDRVRFVPVERLESAETSCGARGGAATAAEGGRAITILRPGLQTTIQDLGRYGYQHAGVPVSGAMDRLAHLRANRLVGNSDSAATIEATLLGPEIRCEAPVTVAVAGGDLRAAVDGIPLPLETVARCEAGSRVTFGERRSGARAYIAFGGGIDVPPVLGSRSTHVGARIGPFEGRALAPGDRLPIGPVPRTTPQAPLKPLRMRVSAGARVRIVRGPQEDRFPPEAFERLAGHRFIVTPQSNRMGYRLAGSLLPPRGEGEMISDATFTGAIQVPPSGEPIVLTADRQTTGGYPQIGVVIAADLPLLGQLAPGDWIEFAWCSPREARTANADARVPA